ncbi:MAG: xanthine dehydrogenase small subunit [Rudaea sp.]
MRADTPIRFVLDGECVEISGMPPTTTVLEYLRERAGRMGTKEGCAEGDCGACTVVVGELVDADEGDESVRYRAINSCIRFLPTLDGRELVTVESLAAGEDLHPVQQAMVDAHGSQCGFCTPGFVMSLFALYLAQPQASRDDVVTSLSGNLCRCTGYRPIIDAGCRMNTYATPARWSREHARSRERVAALQALRRDAMLELPGFAAPRTLAELAALLAAAPQSLLLAGGTDVGLWVTKQLRELPTIVFLGDVAELRRIETQMDGALRIGAAVSLSDAWAAIVSAYPSLIEVAERFASPPVRNSGTLVGNVANGSPIGDAMPALIALGATIELRCANVLRTLPLEAFYLDYMKKDLAAGEFVVAVTIPAPRPVRVIACYKLSKRIDQDISAVCAAFSADIAGEIAHDVRIAFGGMAATPARAREAEAALEGRRLDAATIDAACAALAADFAPLSDMRASADYRRRGAQSLLRRFAIEHATGSGEAMLRTHFAPVSP